MNFLGFYWKQQFAFPGRVSRTVEESKALQEKLLAEVLEGKEAFEIAHPYPVSIPALYQAIRRECFGGA